MGMEEIIDVQISLETRTVSQAGFGRPIILGYHTKWADLFRDYEADELLESLVSEGFAVTDPIYLMGASVLRSDPHVSTVRVGRSGVPSAAAKYELTVAAGLAEGDTATAVVSVAGVVTTATHTLTSGQDSDDAAAALQTALDAAAALTATVVGSVVTTTLVDAKLLPVFSGLVNVSVKNVTGDQGYVTALQAISAVDDNFYGVSIANNSGPNLALMAAHIQTLPKLFFGHYAGTVTDYTTWLATVNTSSYHRTYTQYCEIEKDTLFPATEALAYFLSQEPGSATLAFKTLSGVPVSNLSSSERAAIKAAKGNTYRDVGGAQIIQDGWALSGRYIDLTISLDWLTARTRERAYAFIISKPKVPYTDKSVSQVVAAVQAVLDLATKPGRDVLREDPKPKATGPKVASVSQQDRANRLLPDIKFTGELSGAIQSVKIRGTLSL